MEEDKTYWSLKLKAYYPSRSLRVFAGKCQYRKGIKLVDFQPLNSITRNQRATYYNQFSLDYLFRIIVCFLEKMAFIYAIRSTKRI